MFPLDTTFNKNKYCYATCNEVADVLNNAQEWINNNLRLLSNEQKKFDFAVDSVKYNKNNIIIL